MLTYDEFAWELTEPLSTAAHYVGDHRSPGVFDEVRNRKLPYFRKGDRIACLFSGRDIIISERIVGGKTVWHAMEALERGLHRVIDPKDHDLREKIYAHIAKFYHSNTRLDLVQSFENGTLKPIDLLGDHTGFAGNLHREPGGMWVYGLNS